MDRKELIRIRRDLKDKLPADRYEHTLGVEFTSAAMAMRYGEDVFKAELAGLLHDAAKQFTASELMRLCEKDGIDTNAELRLAPQLLHAVYAPYLARRDYGITDEAVLDAIRWHTTGRENMSLLEKIVYIADYIEPGRYKAGNLDYIRELAFRDIDAAMLKITEDTLTYLEKKGLYIDEMTKRSYKWLKEKCVNDRKI